MFAACFSVMSPKTPWRLLCFRRRLPAGAVGTGSAASSGFAVAAGSRRIGLVPVEQIGICHFNDAPAANPPRFEQGDADRVYPGDGCLPLADLLRTLAANGYTGPLSLELFNPGYWALDPAENLRRGLAATREVLAAAGL